MRPLTETLTTVGYVEFDERRLARISSKVKGMSRVEKLHVNFTGKDVKAGETLAELYSPELYQAIQELLLAQQSGRASRPRRRARWAGRSWATAEELVRLGPRSSGSGGSPRRRSTRSSAGQGRLHDPDPRADRRGRRPEERRRGPVRRRGQAMFEVADLSHVWVQAQVYEDQIGLVRVGQAVEATVEAYPGEMFPGKVAFIEPRLEPGDPHRRGPLRPGEPRRPAPARACSPR